ncbi:catalase family protein, partial [Psychrobacter sp. T6-1]
DVPFVTVARLTIPCQDVPDDGNFEIMEHLSFTPFRCLEENRPIGNLQQSRLKAYQIASETRHTLNDVKRQEPKSLKETFDKSFIT